MEILHRNVKYKTYYGHNTLKNFEL